MQSSYQAATRLITLFLLVILSPFSYAGEKGECNQQKHHLQAIENTKIEDGYYGYKDLYYFNRSNQSKENWETISFNSVFFINSKTIITKQQMLDDYEPGVISIEKYKAADKQIILARVLTFESGLEFISEMSNIYLLKNNKLTYIDTYSFQIGENKEYEILMNDRSLLPENNINILSNTNLYVDGNKLCIKMINFLNTRSATMTFTLP